MSVASWVMGLGGALMITAAVGYAAYDGVMVALHRATGHAPARIRLVMEATVLTGGWLLGGRVGAGTVITGALIGPAMQWWLRILDRHAPLPAPVAVAGRTP